MLTSTGKLLICTRFEIAPLEQRSAALPVELSSHWEQCAHLIQFKCTRFIIYNTSNIYTYASRLDVEQV